CQQVGAKLIDGRGWRNELSGFQKFLNSLTPLGLVKQLTHRSGMQFAKIQEGILSCIRDNLDLRVEIDAATTKTASLEVKLDAQLSANRRALLEARAASEAAQSLVSFLSSVAPKYVPDPQRHV